MDHEPDEEFITSLDKCKDTFLNVLLTGENLRNSSLADDVRPQVYHGDDLQSDEYEEERVGEKQIKSLKATCVCGRKFKLGSMVTPEWICRHYITEIANKPKVK
ncbi:unnamed protein product [Lactuca saligna]|uniref:Uncharacterized protein n=1 Tax=Lactuca saligna TaxID=75948 RepID=A0AA36DZ78_LACSI|nr:unnamed protein product [Lactuca saligna]